MAPPREQGPGRSAALLYKGPHGTRVTWREDKGIWRVRYHDPVLARRVERLESSSARALELAEQAERYLEAGYRASDTVAALAACYEEYLESVGRSVRYREKVEGILRLHVLPYIGDLTLYGWGELESEEVLAVAAKRSRALKQNVGQVLRGLVTHGHRTRTLPRSVDPMFGVSYSAKSAAHGVSPHYVDPSTLPSPDEVEALALAFEDTAWPEWGLAVRLATQSALRWGELIGLQPRDVDLRRRIVGVNRAIGQSGKECFEKLPKGDKVRKTIIWESLVDLLGRRMREVARKSGPTGLLFSGPDGGWVERSAFRRGRFIPAARTAGWRFGTTDAPPYNWIKFRHYAATTMLFDLKFDLADVSALLGHSSPAFTLSVYVDPRHDMFGRIRDITSAR